MKLNLKTQTILNALEPLQSVINDNHNVPILQSVKLDFEKEDLYATGTNFEITCINAFKLPENSKKTTFCANFAMLFSIIKSISDEDITIDVKSNSVINIIYGKGNFEMPYENSDEFPETKRESFKSEAQAEGKAFRNSLKVANRFVMNDDIDAMSNISIEVGKKIYIRSTDKTRLFEEKVKGKGDKQNILISGKSSVAIFNLLEECEEIKMKYNDNTIYFKFDNKEIFVLQQQGNFPVYAFKKILGTIGDADILKVDIKSLVTSMRRVSLIMSKEKNKSVRLDISKNKVLVSCRSIETSKKAEETVSVGFKGEKSVAFNQKYLIEILSVFDKQPDLFIDKNGFLFISQKKMVGVLAPVQL